MATVAKAETPIGSSARLVELMEDAIASRGLNLSEHPWVKRVLSGEASKKEIGWVMAQVYHQTVEVVRWLGYAYARCPVKEVRREIFNNLVEEELGGFSNTDAHFNLAKKAALAAGMTEDEIENVALTPETKALIDYGHRLFSQHPMWIVTQGSSFGFEAQSHRFFGPMGEALRKHYGFTKDDTVFFDVHVEADEEHEASILRVLDKYADVEAERQEVLEACRRYSELYYGMLSSNKYVI